MIKFIAIITIISGLSVTNISNASDLNPEITDSKLIKCNNTGCNLVCTPNVGSAYIRSDKIDEGRVTIYTNGVVQYELKMDFEYQVVTSPVGTESCILTNIKHF
jgi:hypothetical protein